MNYSRRDSWFVTSDGVQLSYFDTCAPGKVFVCLHGFMANKESYAMMAEHFYPNYRIISLDQRGHGLSEIPAKGRTLERMALDVYELIQYLNLNDVVLLGESMGGMVALQYVKSFACECLSHLVLGDTTPKRMNDQEWDAGVHFDDSTPLTKELFLVSAPFQNVVFRRN